MSRNVDDFFSLCINIGCLALFFPSGTKVGKIWEYLRTHYSSSNRKIIVGRDSVMNCEKCICRVLKLCTEAEPMPDIDKTNCKDFIDVGKAVEKVKNNQEKNLRKCIQKNRPMKQ